MPSVLNRTVIHPKYGKGVVKQTRNGGSRLYVQYEGQSGCFFTRIDEVQVEELRDSQSGSAKSVQIAKELKPRRLIEAFRHGIVPKDCIADYTFGREREVEYITSWLHDPTENGLVLVGAYGSGKTHILNYIKHIALQENFAASMTEVNPNEAPFSKPKRVYKQIVQDLKFQQSDSSAGGFESLLRKVLNQGLFDNHHYFRHVKKNLNNLDIWQWIQAKEDHPRPITYDSRFKDLPGLYGHHGNTANIFCYLLSSIGWAVSQRRVGLNGLLLIFDEAEALGAHVTETYHHRSSIFLKALLATARNRSDLTGIPRRAVGLDYCQHASGIPFLYESPCNIKVILALTDDANLSYSSEMSRLPQMNLNPLDEMAASQVFDEISSLYQKVYGISSRDLRIDAIRDYLVNDVREKLTYDQGSTRLLVKAFVEALDLMRFYPDANPFEVLHHA